MVSIPFFFNHSELQVSVSYFYNHSGATACLSLSFKKHCGATGIRIFLLKSKWSYWCLSLSFKIIVELLVSVSFF